MAKLEKVGRLKFHTQAMFQESVDTFVRAAGHVLVDFDLALKSLIALDFSRTGLCCPYLLSNNLNTVMDHKHNGVALPLSPSQADVNFIYQETGSYPTQWS